MEGENERSKERQLAFNDFNMEFIIISAATFRRRSSSRDHYQSERAREHWAPKNTEQHKHWHRFGFASHCLLLQPLKWAGLLSLEETADQTQVIPLRWAHFLSLPSFVTHSIEAVAGNWTHREISSIWIWKSFDFLSLYGNISILVWKTANALNAQGFPFWYGKYFQLHMEVFCYSVFHIDAQK